MRKFIEVTIRERVEGAPGFVGPQEFKVHVNIDNITLCNRGEEKDVTFVRLACGATLCIAMPYEKFMKEIEKE